MPSSVRKGDQRNALVEGVTLLPDFVGRFNREGTFKMKMITPSVIFANDISQRGSRLDENDIEKATFKVAF